MALTLTGFWERIRLMTYYGSLVIFTGSIFAVGMAPNLIPHSLALLGFGIFVGVGLGLVGWVADKAVVPLGGLWDLNPRFVGLMAIFRARTHMNSRYSWLDSR